MTRRQQALALLQQARDILAERLVERLLENGDELLNDARGESFCGEIEATFEQIGSRLGHVQQMLGQLPPDEAPAVPPPPAFPDRSASSPFHDADPKPNDLRGTGSYRGQESAPLAMSFSQLSAAGSGMSERLQADPPEPAVLFAPHDLNFSRFVERVEQGRVSEAADLLTELLELPSSRGTECTMRFVERWKADRRAAEQVDRLRSELAVGAHNSVLYLLWECFGLQGIESLQALQTLRARASRHPGI
jgi:hypothetical protein